MTGVVGADVQIKEVLHHLSIDLYERQESLSLALLAALAGESIFLLGPPGVGKSLIARKLKYAFRDGVSFEYLMSKFSTPDEVFGPISIKKLKEEDKYERLTDNYLPGANIVFLDEIWKAGPAIQNALLTVLNEKIYRNGDQDMKVDIRGIITASNELPPAQSSLAPIWDRFLIRLELGNIKKFKNFLEMITNTEDVYKDRVPLSIKFTKEQLDDWSEQIDNIEVPAEVLNTIQVIKIKMEEYNARGQGMPIVIHDRRWKKVIRLCRASAFANGRSKVNLMDCFLLKHCLWSHPSQKQVLHDILINTIADHGYSITTQLNSLRREVQEFTQDVEKEIRIPYTTTEEQLMVFEDEYLKIERDDQKFPGDFIKIKEYRDLSVEEQSVISFYDKDKNIISRKKCQKSTNENAIIIYHDDSPNEYTFHTKLMEKKSHVLKAPHPVIRKFWDERYNQLSQFVNDQIKMMSEQEPEEIQKLNEHLFVEEDLSPIVRRNFDKTKAQLTDLKLILEKTQFSYTEI
jgi:MoxR-like ATPase